MTRFLQSLLFGSGTAFFILGQVLLWGLPIDNKLVPYLLSAIFMVLVAIYLQGSQK